MQISGIYYCPYFYSYPLSTGLSKRLHRLVGLYSQIQIRASSLRTIWHNLPCQAWLISPHMKGTDGRGSAGADRRGKDADDRRRGDDKRRSPDRFRQDERRDRRQKDLPGQDDRKAEYVRTGVSKILICLVLVVPGGCAAYP